VTVKRFHFSLEQVLKLKRQRERLAELKQNQAALALEKARAEVTALWDQLARAAARFETRIASAGSVAVWMSCSRHVDQVRHELGEAEARTRRAELTWQQATAARKELAIAVEALLTLRRQQWQAYRRSRDRQEQNQLDDWGLRLWRQGRIANGTCLGSAREESSP
jgi:flagellar export protein FliJ